MQWYGLRYIYECSENAYNTLEFKSFKKYSKPRRNFILLGFCYFNNVATKFEFIHKQVRWKIVQQNWCFEETQQHWFTQTAEKRTHNDTDPKKSWKLVQSIFCVKSRPLSRFGFWAGKSQQWANFLKSEFEF